MSDSGFDEAWLARHMAKTAKPWAEAAERQRQAKAAQDAEKRAIRSHGKPPKYRNRKVVTEEGTFDSEKEYHRWQNLQLMEKAGCIRDLKRQVTFPLVVNGEKVCDYIADATYEDKDYGATDWYLVVEDCKGMKTPVYRLKAKLFRAVMGFAIKEV